MDVANRLVIRFSENGSEQDFTDDIYGQWLRGHVIHEIGADMAIIFINGDLKLVSNDTGGAYQ